MNSADLEVPRIAVKDELSAFFFFFVVVKRIDSMATLLGFASWLHCLLAVWY